MKLGLPPLNTEITDKKLSLAWVQYFSQLSSYMALGLPGGAALSNYANDAAAAAGGIKLYGYYRNGSVVMQRVV